MFGVNSGWANKCGQELFTVGWVGCGDTPVKPSQPSVTTPVQGGGVSGSTAKKVSQRPILQLYQPIDPETHKKLTELEIQRINEDNELLALMPLLLKSGIIR